MSKLKPKIIGLLLAGSVFLLVSYGDLYGESAATPCIEQASAASDACSHASHRQILAGSPNTQRDVASSNSRAASQAMVLAKQIDINLMMDDVIWLADDARQGRATGRAGEDLAGKWLARRYESLGLQVFKQMGLSSYVHAFTFPYDDEYLQGENIIGVLPGGINADEYVIVSAHYDHLGIKEGLIYNGADDDASGVAAFLEIARVFLQSEIRPQKSIIFIAFSGEELGYIGSGNFCYEVFIQRSVDKITVLNLEMLGAVKGKGTYVNIWDQENALTQPIIAAVVAASEQLDFPLTVSTGLDPGSDAVELLDCKIAATTMDVGGDEAFHENHPYYHTPDDDPEHIDQDGFLKAAQVATIAIWRLANNDFR